MLWVGGEGGMEASLVTRAGIPFRTIPAAGLHGVGLRKLPGNIWQLGRGVAAARQILRDFRPDALFFTGGYLAVPMALAGWRVPSMLYVPDIEPGLAHKTLARFADCIATTTEESSKYFKHATIAPCGYPIRSELLTWKRPQARKALGLAADLPVVLVTGGSKGARNLNRALLAGLPSLLEAAQVIHLTGELDWPEVESIVAEMNARHHGRYHAHSYLHEEMGAALAASDLVISRAGASTLGEYPLFGLPALLVPYPYAWQYQKVNADFLVRHGAAEMLADDPQLAERLVTRVLELLKDKKRLAGMRKAMQSLAQPQAAEKIGRHLVALAEKGRNRG